MKKGVCCFLLVSFLLMLTGCAGPIGSNAGAKKIKVVATVYPVYEFAKRVGGDKIDLTLMTPPGAEPHDWEPTAKDLVKIREAQLFLYQGNGLEPWVEKMLTQNKTTISVAASHDIPTLPGISEEEEEGENGVGVDPHLWLDPVLAQQEVNNIRDALISADEANQDVYTENAAQVNRELAKIDSEYKAATAKFTDKNLVTTHAAFAYLAARYGLNQVAIMGLAPDAEPTPEKMAKVTSFCRQNKVKVVFFETLVSPKLAQMLAKESGATTLVLNPIEGLTDSDMKAGKDYFTLMRENLANLKTALGN